MLYSFNTVLLSAAKTGTPNLIGTALSGSGVNVITLSTNDVGIAFNALSPVLSTLTDLNVQGSTFKISTSYHGSTLAIVKLPSNNISTYTLYTHSSSLSVAATSALSVETEVVDPNSRRKWLLGYI